MAHWFESTAAEQLAARRFFYHPKGRRTPKVIRHYANGHLGCYPINRTVLVTVSIPALGLVATPAFPDSNGNYLSSDQPTLH